MVQDQLVDYVLSQLKLGISRDAVRSALIGVGWAPLDVDDTLKKVEGGAAPAPAQPAASPNFVSFSAPGTVASPAKNPEPQTIRVSDLVSAIAPASSAPLGATPKSVAPGTTEAAKITTMAKTPPSKGSPLGTVPTFTMGAAQKKKGIGILDVSLIVLVVLLGALAGYLFFKNSGLISQIQIQGGQQGVAQSSAVAVAAAQVQALNASNTALMAEIASLTATNEDMKANLSLLAAPAGFSSSSGPAEISLSGTLSAGLGKNTYIITTPYGVKAYVKNSSNSAVAAALQPLLGTTVTISGTSVPGAPNVTVTSVNGSPTSPPVTATTTPTSTTTTSP